MNEWNAADAKRRFAQLIRSSQTSPQIVELRGSPVSVVVSYECFVRSGSPFREKTAATWLAELGALHTAEGDLDPPVRQNRTDQFGDVWE